MSLGHAYAVFVVAWLLALAVAALIIGPEWRWVRSW